MNRLSRFDVKPSLPFERLPIRNLATMILPHLAVFQPWLKSWHSFTHQALNFAFQVLLTCHDLIYIKRWYHYWLVKRSHYNFNSLKTLNLNYMLRPNSTFKFLKWSSLCEDRLDCLLRRLKMPELKIHEKLCSYPEKNMG